MELYRKVKASERTPHDENPVHVIYKNGNAGTDLYDRRGGFWQFASLGNPPKYWLEPYTPQPPTMSVGYVPYQLCPKCNGDGDLWRFNSPSILGSNSRPICDVCNGAKIISQHITNTGTN